MKYTDVDAYVYIDIYIIYIYIYNNTCVLRHVQLFVTPWTVVLQAPLTIEFSRKEYWSKLPFPASIYIYVYVYIHIYIYSYSYI